MKVVILAGGLGTRISEETDHKPKPMIEIGGKPILWHILKIYSHYGLNDFIICCGYKGYAIKEYFKNYLLHQSDVIFDLKSGSIDILEKRSENWKITLVDTGEFTMTGGRLLKIKSLVEKEESFCMTYGDGLSNVKLDELIKFHNNHGKSASVTAVLHEITKLKSDEIAHCDILYHFDSFSFVANHSEISSPYFIVIPEITRNLLGNFFKKYFYNSERRKTKKIYIGRNSFRDLINRSEIRDFFIHQGFEEVFPHQLSIAEKAELFGSASHIVGPGSSALTNLLFSFGKTKILTFVNFARAQDTFFGSLTDSESYDHDLTFLLGKEKISSDLNNSYQIDVQTIESVVKNTNFF